MADRPERENSRANKPQLQLHVPEPEYRPGAEEVHGHVVELESLAEHVHGLLVLRVEGHGAVQPLAAKVVDHVADRLDAYVAANSIRKA